MQSLEGAIQQLVDGEESKSKYRDQKDQEEDFERRFSVTKYSEGLSKYLYHLYFI